LYCCLYQQGRIPDFNLGDVNRVAESHEGEGYGEWVSLFRLPLPIPHIFKNLLLEMLRRGTENTSVTLKCYPSQPTRESGERWELPHRGSGRSCGRKWISVLFIGVTECLSLKCLTYAAGCVGLCLHNLRGKGRQFAPPPPLNTLLISRRCSC